MTSRLISFAALAALAIPMSFTPAAEAGSVRGPALAVTVVLSRDTDTYTRAYFAGAVASVTVRGDGDSDLDVYVYDEAGNLVAKDDDDTDFCIVTWVPRRTQMFTIKVVNRGLANRYTITTN